MSDAAPTPVPVASAPAGASAGADPIPIPPGIDIERLAEKVYRLLLADLRLEQARRGGRR